MTAIEPTIGQKGLDPKDADGMPGREDPMHHLAVLLGIMGGDKYQQETAPTFSVADLDAASQPSAPTLDQSTPGRATSSVLEAAGKYMGVKYVYGGNDPKDGLDCSSFVQRSFGDIGVNLPRVTYDQVKMGTAIADKNQLQPGDLIFLWGDGNRRDGHVGIYTGNGMMINAPHTGAVVRYDKVRWDRVTNMRRVS